VCYLVMSSSGYVSKPSAVRQMLRLT